LPRIYKLVTDTSVLITSAFNPVTLVTVSVTVVGSMYKIIQWFNKQTEKKAIEKAEELKILTEKIAIDVKQYTDMKWGVNHDAIEDLSKNIKLSEDLVKDFHAKLDKITQRQDMVNGNVENIRNDISDVKQDISYVQEDVSELFNDPNSEEDRGRDHDTVSIRRRKDIERDRKRKAIKSEGDWQGKRIHRGE